MIRSMTGFASVERSYEFGRLTWELRSVNHRYLEVGFRVPEEFRSLEPEIRRVLGEYLSRGKVDANLRFAPSAKAAGSRLVLNDDLLTRLVELHQDTAKAASVEASPDPQSLMRWPGVVEEQAPDPQPMKDAALELLAEAAAGLQSSRGRKANKWLRPSGAVSTPSQITSNRCVPGCPKSVRACVKKCSAVSVN